ncbi:MAG: putative aminohydrolase SsnA [Candidatus Hodarchaeales archaeon]|jgi:putative selenium metabolism protein SsnA
MFLVGPGTVISPADQLFLEEAGVVLEEGRILAVDKYSALNESYNADTHLGASNGVILPGLICAHGHFYGAFARGMALSGEAPKNFPEILEKLWWRVDKKLSLEDVEMSALLGAIAAAKAGTTTIFDHHASPFVAKDSLSAITKATRSVGIRCCASFEVSDRDGEEQAEEGIKENVRFIRQCRTQDDPFIAACFGLHASFTISDRTLEACREAAEDLDTGFHVHVAEDQIDTKRAQELGHKGAFSRLFHFGLLNEKSLAIHGVHLSEDEFTDVLASNAWLIHCPESNMNNAVGVAPFVKLGEIGAQRALGTDGYTYDMFREMKVAYLVHKLHYRDPRVLGADELVTVQFEKNSRLAQQYFGKGIGALSVGAPADLIVLDYQSPTPMNLANFPWHLHFGIDAAMVRHTVVGGDLVVKDREVLTADEKQIASHSRALCEDFWDRIAKNSAL